MTEIVAADIGGTHARFAIADIADGRVRGLGETCTLRTGEHSGIETAWALFRERRARPLPRAAAIAFAGTADGCSPMSSRGCSAPPPPSRSSIAEAGMQRYARPRVGSPCVL